MDFKSIKDCRYEFSNTFSLRLNQRTICRKIIKHTFKNFDNTLWRVIRKGTYGPVKWEEYVSTVFTHNLMSQIICAWMVRSGEDLKTIHNICKMIETSLTKTINTVIMFNSPVNNPIKNPFYGFRKIRKYQTSLTKSRKIIFKMLNIRTRTNQLCCSAVHPSMTHKPFHP